MRFCITIIILLLSMGCATKQKPRPLGVDLKDEALSEQEENRFKSALDDLERERYAQAAKKFDSMLVESPTSEFHLIALFNSGAAYEGLRDCKTAGRNYRQTAQLAGQRFPRIEAQALYRLSYAYECMSMPDKVVATLHDVEKRKQHLAPEIGHAEVPARLSSAFAQLGEIKEAQKYFKKAEDGILQLQRQYRERTDLNSLLARTYFFMGRIQDRNAQPTAESYLKGLRFQQMHLIKAIELDVQPWADKSSKSILHGYDEIFKHLESGPTNKTDEEFLKRRAHTLSWIEGGLQAISELKSLRFPGVRESSTSKQMFNQIAGYEKKLEGMLAKNAESNPLTPDAKSRTRIKREGQVKSSPTVLERKAAPKKNNSKP